MYLWLFRSRGGVSRIVTSLLPTRDNLLCQTALHHACRWVLGETTRLCSKLPCRTCWESVLQMGHSFICSKAARCQLSNRKLNKSCLLPQDRARNNRRIWVHKFTAFSKHSSNQWLRFLIRAAHARSHFLVRQNTMQCTAQWQIACTVFFDNDAKPLQNDVCGQPIRCMKNALYVRCIESGAWNGVAGSRTPWRD